MSTEDKRPTPSAAPKPPETGSQARPRGSKPRGWDDIQIGNLVIAYESADDGWWEAIVEAKSGDSFTLRYRDYPDLPTIVRTSAQIALLKP
jgi:hypothetical protein